MGIAVAIALAVAVGVFITLTLKLTFETLCEKIRQKLTATNTASDKSNFSLKNVIGFAASNVKNTVGKLKGLFHKNDEKMVIKAVAAELAKVSESCDNQRSLPEMEELMKKGYSHIIAGIDENNEIVDMEIISDKLNGSDRRVYDFINKSGEGLVVVSA